MSDWEMVVGLEVHVQLKTQSKMFCGCPTQYGGAPNTNVCPTCLGLPGSLPVPNHQAIVLATRAALALGCTIHETSIFARKNYFYPDLPKGYQISQFDRPLATDGGVAIESPERGPMTVSIGRLHVEEDAGKSLHDRLPGRTAIDLNRAGTPLAEIVTGPDMRSPGEAREYLRTLKQLLLYCEISDCNMEEGSLRVDANVSVRKPGETALRTKAEVKNMNSFANVERALQAESERQIAIYEAGGQVQQVTLLFNAADGTTRPLRSKEDSHDYRYFPDPDLPPLVLEQVWIAARRSELPELPAAKKARFSTEFGLPAYHAVTLSAERGLADYFEAVVAAGADAKATADFILETAIGGWNATGAFTVAADRCAALLALVKAGTVSKQGAKQIWPVLETGSEAPSAVAERLGLVQVRDAGALAGWVDEVIAAHPDEVARFRGGEAKLTGFFVGQVMKKSQGKADAKAIQPLLMAKLSG